MTKVLNAMSLKLDNDQINVVAEKASNSTKGLIEVNFSVC